MGEMNWWQKLVSKVVDSKLGAAPVQEKIKQGWTAVDGWKTHLLGAIAALASLVALINQITPLLVDGLQIQDLVIISNSSHLYTLIGGLAAMTGRSALTKYANELKSWQEGNLK